MNELIKQHYEAIKARGFITDRTSVHQFMAKLSEESDELINAYSDSIDRSPNKAMIHEAIDLMAVIANFLYHFDIDVEKAFIENIKYQKSR